MKYLATLLLALAFFLPQEAQASELRRIGEIIRRPLVVDSSTSPRLNVTFSHKDHMGKGFGCATCHHERSLGSAFVSCREEGCHATPGPRERDTMSTFMAFHSPDTNRSCLGCHSQLRAEQPEKYGITFRNCRPCHYRPQVEASAAK